MNKQFKDPLRTRVNEHTLRVMMVCENGMIGRVFGPKEEEVTKGW
jgi:hypothetical protein